MKFGVSVKFQEQTNTLLLEKMQLLEYGTLSRNARSPL
jgi:hypothetical protein